MTLKTDYRGRLTSCDLLGANKVYSATKRADGSIRLVELVEKEVPFVEPIKVNGHWRFPFKVGRKTIADAVRADRDER